MRARRTLIAIAALVGLGSILAPASVIGAPPTRLDPALCAPSQNTFSLTIDNPYFPVAKGQRRVYSGKEQGETIGLRITVLGRTEAFRFGGQRVTTRVVEEVEWLDANANGVISAGEDLIETSKNYFAQTQAGTVCYFGEVVDIYESGVVVSHGGSWRADAPGNAPGIFMPADPQPDTTFQAESAPGVAEDQVTVLRFGTVTVPAGTFADTMKVRDANPLDGTSGTKFYAPRVGLVVDGPLELISL